jgi:hypothetical protein
MARRRISHVYRELSFRSSCIDSEDNLGDLVTSFVSDLNRAVCVSQGR